MNIESICYHYRTQYENVNLTITKNSIDTMIVCCILYVLNFFFMEKLVLSDRIIDESMPESILTMNDST